MIIGFSRFDPFPLERPFGSREEDPLKTVTDKINNAIESIRTWQTLMNIMGYQSWTDPLTQDLHIVIKQGRLLEAEHIGDAAEKVE